MFRMTLLVSLVAFFSLSHSAVAQVTYEDDNYRRVLELEESENGLFYNVHGDGFEKGFAFEVTFYSRNKEAQPIIEIPKADNYADCQVTSMKQVEVEDRSHLVTSSFYRITYSVEVDTSVLGDTGFCLVWAKSDAKETQKIINYTYVTEY